MKKEFDITIISGMVAAVFAFVMLIFALVGLTFSIDNSRTINVIGIPMMLSGVFFGFFVIKDIFKDLLRNAKN